MSSTNPLGHAIDLMSLALKNVRRRPVLTALTTLGIAIGIGAIVAMLSLSKQVESAISSRIDRLGPNVLLVLPIDPASGASSETLQVDPDQLASLEGIEDIGLIYEYQDGLPLTQEAGPNGFPLAIGLLQGSFESAERFFPEFQLQEGRIVQQKAGEVVISDGAANQFRISIGGDFQLNGQTFKAVGVLAPMDDRSLNNAIFLEIGELWQLAGKKNVASSIWVTPQDDALFNDVRNELNAYFAELRQPYSIQSSERLREGVESILEILRTALLGVGLIALIVGALGLMNTMLMAVIERTKEIGVYLSLGARESQVSAIFILEALYLGLLGGLLGTAFGFGLSSSLMFLFSQTLEVEASPLDLGIALQALLIALGVGTLGGLIPARKAATTPPAESLRYE